MTRYSNTFKKPDQHVTGLREHWKRLRTDKGYSDKRNTAVNQCWKPSNDASKADLTEFHREDVALRRARQIKREPNGAQPRNGSIAQGNRWFRPIPPNRSLVPHEHKREIARRLRQGQSA